MDKQENKTEKTSKKAGRKAAPKNEVAVMTPSEDIKARKKALVQELEAAQEELKKTQEELKGAENYLRNLEREFEGLRKINTETIDALAKEKKARLQYEMGFKYAILALSWAEDHMGFFTSRKYDKVFNKETYINFLIKEAAQRYASNKGEEGKLIRDMLRTFLENMK